MTLTLNLWEWEYDGFVFGGDTLYGITRVTGLSRPDSRLDITTKMADHGAFIFGDFLDVRTVTIEGVLDEPSIEHLNVSLGDLRRAFGPRSAPVALRFYLPEWGGGARAIFCIPSRVDIPVDLNYGLGSISFALQFVAEDPRIYDDSVRQRSIALAVAGGFGFPFGFPLDFGGGSSGLAIANNQGIVATKPFARFFGPVTNPSLINQTESKTMKFLLDLSATDFLDVDFSARTVMLNGTSSRYGNIDPTSVWWDLQPGDNSIQFVAESGSGTPTVTLTWRSAWI